MRWSHTVASGGLAFAVVTGCSLFDSRGVALLERPPAERMKIVAAQPEKPFGLVAGGPYARSSFSALDGDYAVEVKDFIVAPAQKTVDVELAGAAVFEVREGAGTVTIGDRTTPVAMGARFIVSEAEKLRIEASDRPMILRAHIFKVR